MELKEARALAHKLMRRHRLLPHWTFAFDRAKVRFGRCDFRNKQISLSRYLVQLNDEPEVRETLLHEIAHALAPRGAGHGPAWRAVAVAIGCNGRRCYGGEVARPAPKYKGTCPSCRCVIRRHRRTRIACGKCTATFHPKFEFLWS